MTDKEEWIRIEDDKEVTDEMLEAQKVAKRMFRINFKVIEDKMNKKILEQLKNNDSKLKTLTAYSYDKIDQKALAEALKINTTLTSLNLNDLSANKIKDEGAVALAEALKINTTLKDINLGNNRIEDEGAKALAGALKINTTLKHINLGSNPIGDEGAEALAEALRINKSLSTLRLDFDNIGDAGAEALAEALKINTTLKELDLKYNEIGDEGAEALTEALKINKGLNEFYLSDVHISHFVKKKLFNVLEVNKNLDKFIINSDVKKLVKDLYIKEKILIIKNSRYIIDRLVGFGWGVDERIRIYFQVNNDKFFFPRDIYWNDDSRDLEMYFDFIVKELETIINQSKQQEE